MMRTRREGLGRHPLSVLLPLAMVAGACSAGTGTDVDPTVTSSTTTTQATTTTTTDTTTTTTTTIAPTTTTTLDIEAPEPIPVEPPAGFELVWNDEFDGDEVDLSNWTYDIGGWGWGNGEAQYYTDRPENARIQDGLLIIEARFERFEDSYYTSARLKTEDLQEFQYGRIETRVKVPRGAGLWPAFWMLGADFERDPDEPLQSNWPDTGEIDIMEHVGREPDLVLGTIHGPGYAGGGGFTRWNRQEYDIADEFHTYAIEWDFDGMTWFYDGEPYGEVSRDIVGANREWVFDKPFFILLNLAIGGTFGGTIALDLEFPVFMFVDYVRVYQPVAEGGQ